MAKKVTGVQQTLVLESAKPPYAYQALGGVAVIADNTWSASQGRKKLKVEWEDGPNAIYQSDSYKKMLIERANQPQKVVRHSGDVDAAFAKGGKILKHNYYYAAARSRTNGAAGCAGRFPRRQS